MERYVMHNMIHQDNGNNAAMCPVCNDPKMSDSDMLSLCNNIMKRKQSGGYMYSEKGVRKLTGTKDIKADAVIRPFYEFDEELAELPKEIMLVPVGEWDTTKYGQVTISASDIKQMKKNFDGNVRKGVMIDVDHRQSQHGDAAAGWIKKVECRDDGLWATEIDWTTLGDELVKGKVYKFLSPEFDTIYVDPQNKDNILENVLIATSLVNRPLLKEIPALSFSEGKNLTKDKSSVMIFMDQEKTGPTNNMNKEAILKKLLAGETLTAEEKTFVEGNKTEFSEVQLEAAGVKKEAAKAPEKKEDLPDDSKIAGKEGDKSKTVQMSEDEVSQLKKDADAGRLAFAEMEKRNLAEEFGKFTFSEKGGKYSPATLDKVVAFAQKLTPALRVEFSEIVKELPEKKLFGESGSEDNTTESQNNDALRAEVKKFAEDQKMNFGDALRKMSEMPEYKEKIAAYRKSFSQ
jgi:hypothetical protein